jgi:DNA polymerase-3 subunit beta
MAEKFVVEQKPILAILSSMQPICSKRTTLDATTSILFNVGPKELILKSTDLEISLQSSYSLKECSLTDNKSFLVSGKRLFDIVKELESDITFTLHKTQLSLTSGPVNLALNIKDAQEFPPFPERIENLMQLESSFLLSMLDKVSFLIPQNNANPALNGLYLEITKDHLMMTTTDGHCLAQIQTSRYKLDKPQNWLMPRRAVIELKKILEGSNQQEVFLGTCGSQLVFSGDTFNFFSKLLVNPFPEYKAILDRKGFKPATIDRAHFIKTLRRSSCLLSGQFIATAFGFKNEAVDVSIHNKEVGKLEEKLPVTGFEGGDLDVRFYAPYLLSGLNAFKDETIRFYLHNSAKPIIFETTEQDKYDLTYLVMPVSPTAAQQ